MPLYWVLLIKELHFLFFFGCFPNGGNSKTKERKQIMDRFIRLFGKSSIKCLVADREFAGEDWLEYLNRECIPYHLLIRENFWVRDHVLEIIVSFNKPEEAVSSYKECWQIETAFKAMKTNGFNIEDTHLANIDRIERLFVVMSIAFTWAYLVGIYKDEKVKSIRILKNGRRTKSFSKYGLEEIEETLSTPFKKEKFSIFKILSCTYDKTIYNLTNARYFTNF